MSNTMRSTFRPDDVTLLLKDITGLVEPLPAEIQRAARRPSQAAKLSGQPGK